MKVLSLDTEDDRLTEREKRMLFPVTGTRSEIAEEERKRRLANRGLRNAARRLTR